MGRGHLAAQERLSRRLGEIGFALPGSLARRSTRCGKSGCRCMADPPVLHGPYYLWTRKVGGKTVTKMLTAEQVRRYGRWFDNARRLRDLTGELQALSLQAIAKAEGWGTKS